MDAFHRDRRSSDGHRGICKACARETVRDWAQQNPARRRAQRRRAKRGLATPRPSLEERFWAKVSKGADCWEWTAALGTTGYGVVTVRGRKQTAPRVAYELTMGPIPAGVCVLHRCDNRRCVRPNHLYLGSYRDNALDRESRGRSHDRGGVRNGRARVSAAEVRQLRELRGAVTQEALARRFGISQTQVGAIQRGISWSSVA